MLRLADDLRDRLIDHARRAAPEEACGVLAGETGDGDLRVTEVLPCRNADERPRYRYTIDPGDQMEAFRTIDQEGLDLVGFYHSHPRGPRRPSETDADRASWSGYVYVIVSLEGDEPTIGAWRYTDEGGFAEERISIDDQPST